MNSSFYKHYYYRLIDAEYSDILYWGDQEDGHDIKDFLQRIMTTNSLGWMFTLVLVKRGIDNGIEATWASRDLLRWTFDL